MFEVLLVDRSVQSRTSYGEQVANRYERETINTTQVHSYTDFFVRGFASEEPYRPYLSAIALQKRPA